MWWFWEWAMDWWEARLRLYCVNKPLCPQSCRVLIRPSCQLWQHSGGSSFQSVKKMRSCLSCSVSWVFANISSRLLLFLQSDSTFIISWIYYGSGNKAYLFTPVEKSWLQGLVSAPCRFPAVCLQTKLASLSDLHTGAYYYTCNSWQRSKNSQVQNNLNVLNVHRSVHRYFSPCTDIAHVYLYTHIVCDI